MKPWSGSGDAVEGPKVARSNEPLDPDGIDAGELKGL